MIILSNRSEPRRQVTHVDLDGRKAPVGLEFPTMRKILDLSKDIDETLLALCPCDLEDLKGVEWIEMSYLC